MSFPDVGMSPAARDWFEKRFGAPTPVQDEGFRRLARGENALLIAPTGSGKTLAAFFYFIDRLSKRPETTDPGVRVLYVSPLKALVYDIERNLREPLAGIQRVAEERGESFLAPRVAIRTGDTTQKERRAQLRNPAEILVTTPESLYLLLSSSARETLRSVETIIIDEIHALAPSKRGAHLSLSLERLAALTGDRDPTRVGLSATARPLEGMARFLGGDRPVSIVDTSVAPDFDLSISVPVPDMTRLDVPASTPASTEAPFAAEHAIDAVGEGAEEDVAPAPPVASLWPAIYPKLLEAIQAHRSAIVFVNSRGLCEKLAHELNEQAGEELVRAHHGSIAHDKRMEIEESLKAGTLRGIVATSSLELGIDMGAVDLVLLVESPGAVSRGLQRIGRAGHQVGERSRGMLFPKHRGDLLEATVVADGMRRGEVEPIAVPKNPLDVLAQQIVAIVSGEGMSVESLFSIVRRAANYRELSRDVFLGVLDMLTGKYPSTDFAELRPRLNWDRNADWLDARRGSGRLAILSGGTIPDRGLYPVHLGDGGPRIGELDEEMVHETRPGEPITLGASTWRVTEITRDRVLVVPAPGEAGKLPFWHGDGPGRPVELGRRVGALTRELAERMEAAGPFASGMDADKGNSWTGRGGLTETDALVRGREAGERWLREDHGLDEWAARNLVSYVLDQHEATGSLPTDQAITVERFRDELGDWRFCILSPFGARLHAPWALAIESMLSEDAGFDVQAMSSDDGIVLRFADCDRPPSLDQLLPDPEELEEQVVSKLAQSSLFAAQFRENAARALLLPRRRPGARTPLWVQRLRSQNLQAVAQGFPDFPIMLETYRSCLQDIFDVPGLRMLLVGLRDGSIRVDDVETPVASPFARSLVFAYTAVYLYQVDMPVAERRAQALSLDRNMLRELLGAEQLRELLDEEVIADFEAMIQGRTEARRAEHLDGLHDLLRRLGDLSEDEVAARCAPGAPEEWLVALRQEGRAFPVEIASERRWLAVEDVALIRDALGVASPEGVPAALLRSVDDPFQQLILRYARNRGPFVTEDFCRRYGLLPNQMEPVLVGLERTGRLLSGDFHPKGVSREWCEPDVLRRLRRLTLAKLREAVAPVEAPVLARFLSKWHGLDRPRTGDRALSEVLEQLEGCPVSFAELEGAMLPARIRDFDPRMLDEVGALGQWVWVGHGKLGQRDGRIALYQREQIGRLLEPRALPEEAHALHQRILSILDERGASFFAEIWSACEGNDQTAVSAALWDLVWWGQVTNDTFVPLRGLAAKTPTRSRGVGSGEPPRARAPRRAGRLPRPGRATESSAAGRWSLVQGLLGPGVEPTVRAHARASGLMNRYGILSRDAMSIEDVPFGWSGIYPVLRAMEESGKIRRGHFVEGLNGAQFSLSLAVELLRGARRAPGTMQADVLSATDPANPYGALLGWPVPTSDRARPKRAAGARVVLVDGEVSLFVDKSMKRIWSFQPQGGEDEVANREARMICALRSLGRPGPGFPRGGLRIEECDGESAAASRMADLFRRAGFRRSYKGFELESPFADP